MISNILYLITGLGIGITIMCLIQINRITEYNNDLSNREDEIKNLKKQLLVKTLDRNFIELPNQKIIIRKNLIDRIEKKEEGTKYYVKIYDKDGILIEEFQGNSKKDRDKFYDSLKKEIDVKVLYVIK